MEYDVTVVVPIYNMAAHVADGVAALREQTCRAMQVILVNDGSTDETDAVAREAIRGLDDFTLVTTENRGSGPARNEGIARARGRYLYFYDIDDRLEPRSIERMVALADEARCDLLVFSFTRTKDFAVEPQTMRMTDATADGDAMRANYQDYMDYPTAVAGAPWNKLFRRDVVVGHGLEFPPLRRHQDEGFIMRYAAVARSVRFSSEVLYHHLLNNQSRRWQKYPLDYGAVVEGLMDMYEAIVIGWNPRNDAVRERVFQIYYSRNLDVLKVLFNPKWKLSHAKRFRMLVERQKAYEERARKFEGLSVERDRYWPLIQNRLYLPLYLAVWYRVSRNDRAGS